MHLAVYTQKGYLDVSSKLSIHLKVVYVCLKKPHLITPEEQLAFSGFALSSCPYLNKWYLTAETQTYLGPVYQHFSGAGSNPWQQESGSERSKDSPEIKSNTGYCSHTLLPCSISQTRYVYNLNSAEMFQDQDILLWFVLQLWNWEYKYTFSSCVLCESWKLNKNTTLKFVCDRFQYWCPTSTLLSIPKRAARYKGVHPLAFFRLTSSPPSKKALKQQQDSTRMRTCTLTATTTSFGAVYPAFEMNTRAIVAAARKYACIWISFLTALVNLGIQLLDKVPAFHSFVLTMVKY